MPIFAAMFHHFHEEGKYIKGQGSIDKNCFLQLLLNLQKHYNILHPADYAERVLKGKLRTNEICLTFDDALKSQVDIALPVLQELELNAFFFVYSGAFDGSLDNLEVFRDFRHREFADMDAFYAAFFVRVAQDHAPEFTSYQCNYPMNYLSEFPFYSENDRRFRYLRDQLLSSEAYEETMFSMMTASGYSISEHGPKLFMTTSDLDKLCAAGNLIGLHSSTHPIAINQFSVADQWNEYSNNKFFLEEATGTKIFAMSHPCGRYTDDTLKILQELEISIGFRSSLAIREIRSSLEIPREDHANLVKELL